jgi:hypothetical protein
MLEYFMAICYMYFIAVGFIMWPFDVFFVFWYFATRKIWQPCVERTLEVNVKQHNSSLLENFYFPDNK